MCADLNSLTQHILVPRAYDPSGLQQGLRARLHSGQTTGHARDLNTSGDPSGHFPAMECSIKFSDFNTLRNEQCVSLRMKYCWASFCSWTNHYLNALPCMNEVFYGTKWKRGDPEHVNSTRKFTIVAEIVSLLRKIYKRDAPFRAVFEVKTLAVLVPPYPSEMKTNTRNLNLPPFWRLLVSMEMVQPIPTRALSRVRGLSALI